MNDQQQLLVVPSIEEAQSGNVTSYSMFNENSQRQDHFANVPIDSMPPAHGELSHIHVDMQPTTAMFYNQNVSKRYTGTNMNAHAIAFKHPEFSPELEREELVATYATTTYKREWIFQLLLRIFYYCSCLVPSVSHTLMISNKRCVAIEHEVQNTVLFKTKISKEFIKNLTSIDVEKSVVPYRLYRVLPHAAFWFIVLNVIPLMLLGWAVILSFSSLFIQASLTLLAMFFEIAVDFSVIGLLLYNRSRIDKKEVSTLRIILFFLFMGLALFVSGIMALAGFISGGLSPLPQPVLGIPFSILNGLALLFVILALLFYPTYPHQHKTELKLVYRETVHGRTQTVLLEEQLAGEAQHTLLSLRKDIEVITSGHNTAVMKKEV